MFICDCCGDCCRNLNRSELYADLDRGDGVCLHLDENSNLCRIYATRPLKCRVIDSYSVFEHLFTFEEYLNMNYEACRRLKEVD